MSGRCASHSGLGDGCTPPIGMRDMLSTPPTRTRDASPRRTLDAAMAVASRLLAHMRVSVMAGTRSPRLEAVAHEGLQLAVEALAVAGVARHHVGDGLDESVRVGDADHRALGHAAVLQQAALHVLGREPLSRDLEHLVAAPAVANVAVRV